MYQRAFPYMDIYISRPASNYLVRPPYNWSKLSATNPLIYKIILFSIILQYIILVFVF